MGSHNLLFEYRFLSCSDPKLNLGVTLNETGYLRVARDDGRDSLRGANATPQEFRL
jgi:hypothetical protein